MNKKIQLYSESEAAGTNCSAVRDSYQNFTYIENFYNERRIKIKQRNLVIDFFYCVYLLLFIRPQYLLDLTKRSNWGVFLSHKTSRALVVHHLLYPHRVSCYDIQPSKPHTSSSFHLKKEIYPPSGLVTQRRYYFKKNHTYSPYYPASIYLFPLSIFTNLFTYSHYPCHSISMSFNQSYSNPPATFGTYNNVAGNQTTTTTTTTTNGPVNSKYCYFYHFSTLINE